MSIDHYENFPVGSCLLPRHIRPAVIAIYRFARTADDYADEGDATIETRLAALAQCHNDLDVIAQALNHPTEIAHAVLKQADPKHTYIPALYQAIRRHQLPLSYFRDLLTAFTHDVTHTRYADNAALLTYCQHSANPIGRLMLTLVKCATPDDLMRSDAVCTGLQLVNFWQDIAIDWNKGRVYIPQTTLAQHGVTEHDIATQQHTPSWQKLMNALCQDAQHRLLLGIPLALRLPGRFGWEIQITIEGGLRILEKIANVHYNIFDQRPQLTQLDWLIILSRTLKRRITQMISG